MVYGYIRVSTGKQTLENQKIEIRRYCKERRLRNIQWVAETVSGTRKPEKRKLGKLLSFGQSRKDTNSATTFSRRCLRSRSGFRRKSSGN